MKKFLLVTAITLFSFVSGAQVIFYVESPSPNEGSYDLTYATPGGGWGTPDLADPVNAITAEVEWVSNGVDSLSCDPLTVDLTGKIAVLYRGDCEFGLKALNAYNAGAVGVIIINVAGEPVGMGPGADGATVPVPVVMISSTAGSLLKAEFEVGTTTVFIGTKTGLYDDDMGMTPQDYLRAQSFGVPGALNLDDTEFEVEVGSWVRNYGLVDQSDVQLQATIVKDGSTLYDEISAAQAIDAGDSMFIPLPTFSQSSYENGLYEMDYTIVYGGAEEADFDNQQECDFFFSDSLYSLCRIDPSTSLPVQNIPQFNGATSLMETCLHFQDPNASRVRFEGVTFAGNTSQFPEVTSMDGAFFEVYVYEWNDGFTDFNDYPDWNTADLNEVDYASYIYTSDLQGVPVWVPFDDKVQLNDDQRYMICLTFDPTIYPGYDNKVDYTTNFDNYLQPLNVLRTDLGQYFALGFGGDQSPSLSINLGSATANIVELPVVDLDAYPNPAMDFVNIPMKEGHEGNVFMQIFDLDGRMIESQDVSMQGNMLQVDVTSVPAGTYVIDLQFANGEKGTVQVAVIH